MAANTQILDNQIPHIDFHLPTTDSKPFGELSSLRVNMFKGAPTIEYEVFFQEFCVFRWDLSLASKRRKNKNNSSLCPRANKNFCARSCFANAVPLAQGENRVWRVISSQELSEHDVFLEIPLPGYNLLFRIAGIVTMEVQEIL